MTAKKPTNTRVITLTRKQFVAHAARLIRFAECTMKHAILVRDRAEKMTPGSHWNPRTKKVVSAPITVERKPTYPKILKSPKQLRQFAVLARKRAEGLEKMAAKLEAAAAKKAHATKKKAFLAALANATKKKTKTTATTVKKRKAAPRKA